ncbi:DNA-3-methyladenine glycosylase I [Chitinimonas lacunae]|uniref:DNA-3-methyladenine glycosylase I n=1 Tax=Chitinimonas lacunae TaxID=1963018 RepID=A0ABV8MMB0_9NEIS
MTTALVRCSWANPNNPRYLDYHDHEWGVPCHDETRLFEMLNLEGAQAGLSWETILNKREHYRSAFADWDAEQIVRFDEARVAELLANPGIVRNRLKVAATINNARAYLALRERGDSLDGWLWRHVDGVPLLNRFERGQGTPTRTELSDTVSKGLSRLGFKFVGTTIIYAYLQAIGVVNDHLTDCFCHPDQQG